MTVIVGKALQSDMARVRGISPPRTVLILTSWPCEVPTTHSLASMCIEEMKSSKVSPLLKVTVSARPGTDP